jgi:hypothetical protein
MLRKQRELYERLIEQTPRLLARTSPDAGAASLLGALGTDFRPGVMLIV